MRLLSTENLREGVILGRTIYGSKGETLLRAGTALNAKMIKRLNKLDFKVIYIDDEFSGDADVKDVIKPELRNEAVHRVKKVFNSISEIDERTSFRFDKETGQMIKNIVAQVMANRDMMVEMIDLKTYDEYTFQHSVNVGVLSAVIGAEMNFSHKDMIDLTSAAIFHDIGKMFIPQDILNKPGKLTEEEFGLMQNHPRLGYEFASKYLPLSITSVNGILLHHEKCNGNGYPYSISKPEISSFAKIISICDVYDALTSDRCYKKAVLPSEAIEYIMASGDEHFDAEIINVFLKKIAPYPVGISVELSNGEKGLVFRNNPHYSLRPVIRLYSDAHFIDLMDRKNASVVITKVLI